MIIKNNKVIMFNKSKSNSFTEAQYQELLIGMTDKASRDVVRLCLRPNCNAAPRWFRELESIFLKAFSWKVNSKKRNWWNLFLAVASCTEGELEFNKDLLTSYKIEVEDEFMFGKEFLEVSVEYIYNKFINLRDSFDAVDPSKIDFELIDYYLVDWYNSLKDAKLTVGYKSKE